jgi:hypothetical protein
VKEILIKDVLGNILLQINKLYKNKELKFLKIKKIFNFLMKTFS